MITIKQVMEIYGVSRTTVQDWMKKGLPHYKVNRLVRFIPAEVANWIGGYRK